VLFLVDVPDDMGPYYRNYYSTADHRLPPLTRKRALKYWLGRYALTHDDPLATRILRSGHFPLEFQALAGLGLGPDSRILDVGSGTGVLVGLLDACGFRRVLGCDPFIDGEIAFANGARVLRAGLEEVPGEFDLVMLHHAFEHVPNPRTVAEQIAARLAPGGTCLLRFPHVESVEFRRFGGDWWGIHAPRHFYLHSRRSLELVFADAGMRITHAYCDSRADHYLYSTEYALDIDDRSPLSYRNGRGGLWLDADLAEAAAKAQRYNRLQVGDWVVYHLRKV